MIMWPAFVSQTNKGFFKTVLTIFEDKGRHRFDHPFPELTQDEKSTLIGMPEDQSSDEKVLGEGPHFYAMIEQLTVWGIYHINTISPGCFYVHPSRVDMRGAYLISGEKRLFPKLIDDDLLQLPDFGTANTVLDWHELFLFHFHKGPCGPEMLFRRNYSLLPGFIHTHLNEIPGIYQLVHPHKGSNRRDFER